MEWEKTKGQIPQSREGAIGSFGKMAERRPRGALPALEHAAKGTVFLIEGESLTSRMVELVGIEPTTSDLQSPRSSS